MKDVRVRFAPSPTGPLHIGGVRTALYNYLFAKKNKGTFVLRIEDTDQKRFVEGAEEYIMKALTWCGIPADETVGVNEKYGPYRQSERKDIYQKYIEVLINKGWAYRAFDTTEALEELRDSYQNEGKVFSYNWETRENLENELKLGKEKTEELIKNGLPYVIRFKVPADENLIMQDTIRGEITINTKVIDDKVLFKNDGLPTYHFANIVDDHLMQISHVIRGEEWLPSMGLHILLYKAFEWDVPVFAHLPLILKPKGKGKLSKRDGDQLGFPVFPLEYKNEKEGTTAIGYKEEGYEAEAFINMLAFLGWNPGTEEEILSLDELVNQFDLSKVNKAGARFDVDKTKWINQQYVQKKEAYAFLDLFEHNKLDKKTLEKIVMLVKERAVFRKDVLKLSDYFFNAPSSYDEKAYKKQIKEGTKEILEEIKELVTGIEDFESDHIETKIKGYITEKELGFGKVMAPLRLAVVGTLSGPHLFDIIEIIGKEETVNRLNHLIDTIK